MRVLTLLLGGAMAVGCFLAAVSDVDAAVPALPGGLTNTVRPTVTATMGDRGGHFFGQAPTGPRVRRYFIAAEPQRWDYAPAGRDVICGKVLPEALASNRTGSKTRYVRYTDDTFAAKAMDEPRLGLLGPVLRGVVGDYLVVTFLNRGGVPLSMHPHGVRYDKDSEGAYYQPGPGLGAAVGPGARFTYVWHLDEESGPLPGEPSSKGWLYHSHVESDHEIDRGLVGFIIVTDPRRARPDGTPSDVDREMAALFLIHDESGLGGLGGEAAEYGGAGPQGRPLTWAQTQEMLEQGARFAINGYTFGNAPGLEMRQGERVRWYLFGLGSEQDFHTAHWHGLRVIEEGRRRTDVVELLPASMKVADMVAATPGEWLFHCHVAEHMSQGMFARVVVHPSTDTGADAALQSPFFGTGATPESLRIRSARIVRSTEGGRAAKPELRLQGSVTVFQAFSVFSPSLRLQLGDHAASFKCDRQGEATTAGVRFKVTNASPYGVVYGGVMEFEAALSGAEWSSILNAAGAAASGEPIPVVLELGSARHFTSIRLQAESP